MQSIHEASLVDPSLHSPALMELLETKMNRTLIEYVVDCVVETVDYSMGHPSTSRGRSLSRQNQHAKFSKFASDVIRKAEVKVPALLVTLVYIDRAKPHLQIALEQWACERVFLGALILANKYLNDSTLKNIHWALCTGVFGKRDVGRIEREFLDVLDFELGFHEADILSHHDAIISLTRPHRHRSEAAGSPLHHHHHHHVRTPAMEYNPSPISRWSSDSSDSESLSSVESVSPPQTPESAPMDVDAASVVAAKSKHTPEDSHPSSTSLSSAPSKPQADPVVVHSQSHPHHQRLSSALQLLRSFPIPHFHHSHAPSSTSLSASSSTTLVSSSAPSFSIPLVAGGCKPVSRPYLAAPRTAAVVA